MPLKEILRELQNVGPSLAQRRHTDVDAAQAIEEVRPKQPTLDESRQAAVGCGDDPDVDAVRALAADPLDREILDGPQQFGLRRQREVGDFVQEQRAAIGRLELASPAADAGGRAIFDAEQLGLEQRFDKRRAIDGDERAVAAPAQFVDLPCDELLADAAFAFEQHREVGDRHSLDRSAECGHDRGRSNQRRRAVSPHPRRRPQPGARQLQPGPLDFQDQRADVRGHAEHLKVPFPEPRRGIECRFEHAGIGRIGARHFDGERFGAAHFGTADPPAAGFSQLDRADRHGAPHQSSNAPRMSEMSLRRSSARVSAASISANACRRSRCRAAGWSMAAPEPNGVPPAAAASSARNSRKSKTLVAISNPQRGNFSP